MVNFGHKSTQIGRGLLRRGLNFLGMALVGSACSVLTAGCASGSEVITGIGDAKLIFDAIMALIQ